MESGDTDWILVILMLVLYFAPVVIGWLRDMASLDGVVIVNLFLGWTFLGWVGALVWAFSGETRKEKVQRLGQN